MLSWQIVFSPSLIVWLRRLRVNQRSFTVCRAVSVAQICGDFLITYFSAIVRQEFASWYFATTSAIRAMVPSESSQTCALGVEVRPFPNEIRPNKSLKVFAIICLGSALVAMLVPAFYSSGSMQLAGSILEEKSRVESGRGTTILGIQHWNEMRYAVRILDQRGAVVTEAVSSRLPSPTGGEPIRFLPAWPKLHVPDVDYRYSNYLTFSTILGAIGCTALLVAAKVKKNAKSA